VPADATGNDEALAALPVLGADSGMGVGHNSLVLMELTRETNGWSIWECSCAATEEKHRTSVSEGGYLAAVAAHFLLRTPAPAAPAPVGAAPEPVTPTPARAAPEPVTPSPEMPAVDYSVHSF
jgi:hypothetical protein